MGGEIIFDQDEEAPRPEAGTGRGPVVGRPPSTDASGPGSTPTPPTPEGHPAEDHVGHDHLGEGVPLVTSTPSGNGHGPRHAHSPLKPTRRERRALRKERIRTRRTIFGRHPKTTVLFVIVLALTPVWISAGSAATNPALGLTVGTRLTEWVRDHGGGPVVTWAENVWYSWHAPAKGGKPNPNAIPAGSRSTTTTVAAGPPHLAAPAAIVPFVANPTPGEGQWHPIGRTVDGIPTMYAAYLRPNAVYTSLVTGVAWMDTKLLSTSLYGGSMVPTPGPPWPQAPLTGVALDTLTAAFNSGFRMPDSGGGFYLNGVTSAGYPLVPGAASLVITKDGSVTVGAWGTDVSMSPNVVAVRQNLALIVNNGLPVPGLNANDNHQWGYTLGGGTRVWRSGVGITADGALVYVGGSGLTIVDVANLLARAGAVRAMELDINTDWVNFSSFAPAAGLPASAVNGTDLTYDEATSPGRYFGSLARDFFTMSVRQQPVTPTATSGKTTTSTTKPH